MVLNYLSYWTTNQNPPWVDYYQLSFFLIRLIKNLVLLSVHGDQEAKSVFHLCASCRHWLQHHVSQLLINLIHCDGQGQWFGNDFLDMGSTDLLNFTIRGRGLVRLSLPSIDSIWNRKQGWWLATALGFPAAVFSCLDSSGIFSSLFFFEVLKSGCASRVETVVNARSLFWTSLFRFSSSFRVSK